MIAFLAIRAQHLKNMTGENILAIIYAVVLGKLSGAFAYIGIFRLRV